MVSASAENGFKRSMAILDLFSEHKSLISYGDVVASFGFTKSSAYRHLGNLVDTGFVAPVGHGFYSLGPRIIELERLIVLSDPLLASGRAIMPSLAEEVPNSALLLCSLWGERVLCIHEVRSSLTGQQHPFEARRGRGIPYTLFKGAPSVVLLANLPMHKLRSLFARHREEIVTQGLGHEWKSFSRGLKSIRQNGFAASIDSFHTGRIAIAVPIADQAGAVVGCLARIVAQGAEDNAAMIARLAPGLTRGAELISSKLSALIGELSKEQNG